MSIVRAFICRAFHGGREKTIVVTGESNAVRRCPCGQRWATDHTGVLGMPLLDPVADAMERRFRQQCPPAPEATRR